MGRTSALGIIGLTLFAFFSIPSSFASANGRELASVELIFQPEDSKKIFLQSTIGLLVSKDDGKSFAWVSEKTIGYEGLFDPNYAIAKDGTIYATTFQGLKRSTDESCTYEELEFFGNLTGGDTSQKIEELLYISVVEIGSDGRIWATSALGGASNDIYVSTDGKTFHSAKSWVEKAVWTSMQIAPSDPNTIYAAGYVSTQTQGVTPILRKTSNGGESWIDLPLTDFVFGTHPGASSSISLEGVSPTDPDIVFVRVRSVRDPVGEDIYRSSNGGDSFEKVLEIEEWMSGFAIRGDESVFVSTRVACAGSETVPDAGLDLPGCLRKSPDGTANSWTIVKDSPQAMCLGERPSDRTFFSCDYFRNAAIVTWNKENNSWNNFFRFIELKKPLQCPEGTIQNKATKEDWPFLCQQLGICADTMPPDAGLTPGAEKPANEDSCLGCRSSSGSSSFFFLALLGLAAVGLRTKKQ